MGDSRVNTLVYNHLKSLDFQAAEDFKVRFQLQNLPSDYPNLEEIVAYYVYNSRHENSSKKRKAEAQEGHTETLASAENAPAQFIPARNASAAPSAQTSFVPARNSAAPTLTQATVAPIAPAQKSASVPSSAQNMAGSSGQNFAGFSAQTTPVQPPRSAKKNAAQTARTFASAQKNTTQPAQSILSQGQPENKKRKVSSTAKDTGIVVDLTQQQQSNQQQRQGQHMKLYVKDIRGPNMSFDMHPKSYILEVKDQIEARIGVSSFKQRLIYEGRELDNWKHLNDYNIKDGATLHLVRRHFIN
eukprot:TRINITY_DN3986_c0_g1_i7.p1 TRINITY_DN3986_c0_g1~~TRINITY_DN3986_c0_g1_i7.p1  ORF type:complete len:301 (+),score=72.23 TRINITY_DN3986_c0_g1_i7:45-947(+)